MAFALKSFQLHALGSSGLDRGECGSCGTDELEKPLTVVCLFGANDHGWLGAWVGLTRFKSLAQKRLTGWI